MNCRKIIVPLCVFLLMSGTGIFSQKYNVPDTASLNKYKTQLALFGSEYRIYNMPDVAFYLFGMGNRTKLLYKDGRLIRSLTGEILYEWPVRSEYIIPNKYMVQILTTSGELVTIHENEKGVFINEGAKEQYLEGTNSEIHLPDFNNCRYSEILKVLHQEILVNIIDSKPVPNYFVYKNPWRRDAAMMAMCLEKTRNLDLIKDWVLNLSDPYDHNNGARNGQPETEADYSGMAVIDRQYVRDKISVPHTWHASEVFLYLIDL